MPPDSAGARPVPDGHQDRIRWNARYAADYAPSFTPHPLAVRVFGSLAADLPDGPVADLACGPSGTALLAAAHGRRVTAVDVSEVALRLLGAEATRRGLGDLITLVHADLSGWSPSPRSYALVLCTGLWDSAVFTAATSAVARGGLLAWEASPPKPGFHAPACPRSGAWPPASPRRSSRQTSPS